MENKTEYTPPKIIRGNNSEFTLLVYFKTGYVHGMKFHSGKQEIRKIANVEIKDLRYALSRLVMLIEDKFKDDYKTALIYHNPTKTEIFKYAYGQQKDKAALKWIYKPNGDVLCEINKEEYTGDAQKAMIAKHKAMNLRV